MSAPSATMRSTICGSDGSVGCGSMGGGLGLELRGGSPGWMSFVVR